MKYIKGNIFTAFFLFVLFQSIGQTDPCITKLTDAGSMITDGRYDEAISILNQALADCNYSKDDRIEANKALIKAYLEIDNLEKAEAGAAEIMRINPNYKPDKLRDSPEMIALFEKYKPTPILRVGLIGGINNSILHASNTYSVVSDDDTPGLANYSAKLGFQIGVLAEYRLYKDLWLNTGFTFRKVQYENEVPNVEGRTIFYSEELNYFDVPLGARYYFLKGRLNPYLGAGAKFSFLSSALGELSRDDVSDIVDRNSQRNSFQMGYMAEAGFSYSLQTISVQLGFQYVNSPDDLNKEGTRYNNLPSIFQYYYLDNDFTLDHYRINVAFIYNIKYRNIKSN